MAYILAPTKISAELIAAAGANPIGVRLTSNTLVMVKLDGTPVYAPTAHYEFEAEITPEIAIAIAQGNALSWQTVDEYAAYLAQFAYNVLA